MILLKFIDAGSYATEARTARPSRIDHASLSIIKPVFCG